MADEEKATVALKIENPQTLADVGKWLAKARQMGFVDQSPVSVQSLVGDPSITVRSWLNALLPTNNLRS